MSKPNDTIFVQLSLFDPIRIPLTQGQEALISYEDIDLVQFKWYATRQRVGDFYAQRHSTQNHDVNLKMHRVILERILGRQLSKCEECDHIDGNKLNNQRCNLRTASKMENIRNRSKQANNTSGLKGVSWHKRIKKWAVNIGVNGKRIHIGYYETKDQAQVARDEATIKYHGEFARLE